MTDSAVEEQKAHAPAAAIAVDLSHFRRGTDKHKQAMCGVIIDAFDSKKSINPPWPTLSDELKHRITSLPFWDLAMEAKGHAASRVQAFADHLTDPLLKKATAMTAYEEGRTKLILLSLFKFYDIHIPQEKAYGTIADPEWLFLRSGYTTCFDNFFAFGLFKLAKDSGHLPPELVDQFETILQDEARHALFFINWLCYAESSRGLIDGTALRLRGLMALAATAYERYLFLKMKHIPHDLIKASQEETERRMAPYNARLPRPKLMAFVARVMLLAMGGHKTA